MKNVIALLLAALLVFSLAGCAAEKTGNKPPQTTKDPTQAPAPTETAPAPTETAPAPTETAPAPTETAPAPTETAPAPTETTPAPTETAPAPTETAPAPTESPTGFTEMTVIDTDDCLLRITGFEKDDFWGNQLTVYLENRTEDKTLMFTTSDGAVNGVSWEPLFAVEVEPGKKANDEMSFINDELEALLPEFTDIELALRVYDSDDWTADDLVNTTVHIYPQGKENATVYVRDPQPTDTVLVDNAQITVIVTGYEDDPIWGYTANLYLVNKTDRNLMFSCDDVSVNGIMCDPYWATTVMPGKQAFSAMRWSDDSFEENGITEVQEIEMLFRVYDSENWSAGTIFEETVTLKP